MELLNQGGGLQAERMRESGLSWVNPKLGVIGMKRGEG